MNSLSGVTFIVLLTLKLTGTDISWFWVFFPLVIPLIAIGVFLVFSFIIIFLDQTFNKRLK